MQRGDVQAPAVQRAAAEVLHQHVELGKHGEKYLPAARLPNVERDAALAAVGHLPPQRHAVLHGLQAAQGVAAVGQFQLHDIGAVIGTQSRAHGGREHGRHVEDAHAREGAGGA